MAATDITSPQAYYNAGSAALVLVLIALAIGTFLWCRLRRRRVHLPVSQEENIPLNASINRDHVRDGDDDDEIFRNRKGKERAQDGSVGNGESQPIFDVGDSDEEDTYNNSKNGNGDRHA